MPQISGPAIVATKNGGTLVNAVNLALNFIGFGAVTNAGGGQTNITAGGGGGGGWDLTGNALTGSAPDEPNEILGSTNDFDVVLVRNSTDFVRLGSQGIFFGNTSAGANGFYFGRVTTSLAFGVFGVNTITTLGHGCLAFGDAAGFNIAAAGAGNFVGGRAETGDVSVSAVFGSMAFGDDIQITTGNAQGFGRGHQVTFQHSMAIGRWSDLTVNPIDPLFTVGNGANAGAKSNAFRIDDDGRETTVASQVNTAIRVVAGAGPIDARTDRTIVYDTNGAGGNLQLPPGEKGLMITFTPLSGGVSAYTLVADGAETFDAAVTPALTAQVERIQFLGGVWYSV